jgi:hypothetical protein
MNSQSIRTSPATLGPFLSLILNARTKADSGNENPCMLRCGERGCPPAFFRQAEDATAETQAIDIRRQILGPFVSLVLRLLTQKAAERLRTEAEYDRRRQAAWERIQVGR